MNIITKENIQVNPEVEGSYQTTIHHNGRDITLAITPDDVALETTIDLANKMLSNLEVYENKARQKIITDFLDTYNESWRDESQGEPAMDETTFSTHLNLVHIWCLSADCFDFYFSENGLFGHHSLIAESFDGENFESSTMFG